MHSLRRPLAATALLLAAAAGLGALGAAVAQDQVQECGPVSLSPDSYERTVAEGGSAEIVLEVANDGAVGGQVWVNATPASGWTVDVDPASFALGAAETKEATLTASPSDASAGSPYEMGVSADLECTVDTVGQSAGSDRAEETLSLQLQGGDSGGESSGASAWTSPVTSAPGMGLLILGSVAVLSVVGYPRLQQRRRSRDAPSVTAPQPAKRVEPGRGVTFPVNLANPSGEPANYDLEVGEVPPAWSAFVAVPEAEVAPGEEEAVEVLLRAPGDAEPGDGARVTLRVRPQGADGADATVDLTAHVTPD